MMSSPVSLIYSRVLAGVLLLCIFSFNINAVEKGYVPRESRVVKPMMKVLAEEDRVGYVCQLVEYSVDNSFEGRCGRRIKDSERIKGYLLVPDAARKGKCPALVMLHDHGARFDIGKEKLVRPIASVLPDGDHDHIYKSSQQWVNKYFDGVYLADSLAANGYVVFVADAYYWGDRSTNQAHQWSELTYGIKTDTPSHKQVQKELKKSVYDGQTNVHDAFSAKGVIWAEKILRDDVASARLLARLPYVDKNHVGAFGFSMGAHRCWLLTAFCKHVKYGIAVSWMTSLESYDADNPSDLSMRIQPMRDYMDFGDIGMYLSPKPMLFLSGDSDHLFPKEDVKAAFQKLHKHYNADKAALRTEFFQGGHHCGKSVQQTIMNYIKSF